MLRRIVCFTALASILALTGCNGRSIDYLIARASLILSNHTNKSTVLVVTSIPVLTKLVKMETPTQLPVKVVSLLTSTPSPTVETVATLTPGLANTSTQASAIEKIRADLDLPRLPLVFIETTNMINSPTGRLKVSIFQDTEGRKYSVDPISNRVVEIDARSLLTGLPSDAPSLTEEELKSKANKYFQATVPDFLSRQLTLQYQEGGKGDLYFFDWRGQIQPGSMMPPFVQIGLNKRGFMFAYYNTLQPNK